MMKMKSAFRGLHAGALVRLAQPGGGAVLEETKDNGTMLFASDSQQLQPKPQMEPQHQ
jgi:hypothetical protein